MITIIDYDAGNIQSVANMLRAAGIAWCVSRDPGDVEKAERLVLPGVGHFDHGMKKLAERGLLRALNQRVIGDGAPILGICLGAQLLTRSSEEGVLPGLGWIAARTVKFNHARMDSSLRIPHMGWADTWAVREHPIFTGLLSDARFYYVHSYHIVCEEPDQAILAAHHGYDFTSGIARANVVGVQFHPEKSHRYGQQILTNFAAWGPGQDKAAA